MWVESNNKGSLKVKEGDGSISTREGRCDNRSRGRVLPLLALEMGEDHKPRDVGCLQNLE